MQIIETNAKYYRVQLPSGQVLTIARTPGTEALVQSKAGLAGGGVIAPEFQPEELDELDALLGGVEAPLIREVPAAQASQPVVGGGPQTTMQKVSDVAGKMLEPWQSAPNAMDLAGPIPGMRRMAASAGALAGDPNIRQEVGAAAAGTVQAAKDSVVVGGGTPGEAAAPVQEAGPELDQDLARLLEPSWLPGEQGGGAAAAPPDLSELNNATMALADTQAKEAETLAAHYESMRLPEQPKNEPINPAQFYERVGTMFGAKNPRSARVIGAIASGLTVAAGEFGAALSHRQNVAAGIIQNSIAENIAQQQHAQALTRQQWLDQTAYLTSASNREILKLAAKAKGPEIKAQAYVMIAKNNLAMLGQAVKAGTMSAAEIAPLAKIEEARAAMIPFATTIGTTAAGPGAAIRAKMGEVPIIGDLIGPPPKDDAALAARQAADTAWLKAMEPGSDRPLVMAEARKRHGKVLFEDGDYGESLVWKAKMKLALLQSISRTQGLRARGVDPKGAGTVTPGARPN